MNTLSQQHPTQDEIARAAYLDWLNAGRPSGCDQKFWLEAEARLGKSMVSSNQPARNGVVTTRRTTPTRKA